jgi:hypothetical protein
MRREKATTYIMIRCTPTEKREFQKKAKKADFIMPSGKPNVAGYIRFLIFASK